jgi:hypothetical protein
VCKEALRLPIAEYQSAENLPAGAQGADILDKLHLVIKIAKDRIEWYRRQIRDNPDFVDGLWKLKTRTLPEIGRTSEAIGLLAAAFGISQERLEDCARLSIGRIRETVQDAKPGLTQKQAKEAIEAALGELIELSETKYLIKEKD